jgi:sugar/nucleoside kinase (ribokinase family)
MVSFDPTFREDIWFSREETVSAYEKSLRYSHVVSMSIDEVDALYGTISWIIFYLDI